MCATWLKVIFITWGLVKRKLILGYTGPELIELLLVN